MTLRKTPNRDRHVDFPLAGKSNGPVYFLGIGGIGMSALARYFQGAGYRIAGYDRAASELTHSLQDSGMEVHYTDDPGCIPTDTQLIVYTPAVPTDLAIFRQCRQSGITMRKRSEVLQSITESSYNICVAGTHGKTTTSTLIAHLLRHSGYGCQAFLGGISVNYDTNSWSSDRNVSVIEADEYDRSFLKLNPDLALITSMDPDHLDIYGTVEAMEEAYLDFTRLISAQGTLIYQQDLKRANELQAPARYSYSLQDSRADFYVQALERSEGGYQFDLQTPGGAIKDCRLQVGGLHNVENAVGAAAVAHTLGIDFNWIRDGLATFRGVKRRFEYLYADGNRIWIDDYAHHPDELLALLQGVRDLYPAHRITLVFQPHLFSRTRDLAAAFGDVLSSSDETVLLPIYPARELPIEGVSAEMLRSPKHPNGFPVIPKASLIDWIDSHWNSADDSPRILLTAGAGDIDQFYPAIRKRLQHA